MKNTSEIYTFEDDSMTPEIKEKFMAILEKKSDDDLIIEKEYAKDLERYAFIHKGNLVTMIFNIWTDELLTVTVDSNLKEFIKFYI